MRLSYEHQHSEKKNHPLNRSLGDSSGSAKGTGNPESPVKKPEPATDETPKG